MAKNSKTVIIIVGPTASGKTNLSLQVADHFKTDIISADSRQCYRELNIGVAKPSIEELKSIKHYFINSHSIFDEVNAEVFEKYALNAANEIFKKNDVAVMVGGTGMYIKAFCEGLDDIPKIDTSIRNDIIKNYKQNGLNWLQAEVEQKDPLFWKGAERQNPQRLMRVLEVVNATGKSITHFRSNTKKIRPFKIIKIGIDLPKQKLHENIDKRVNQMVNNGLIEEVKSFQQFQHLNALQTVGYKEVFDYLSGRITLEQSITEIKSNTKKYAKRQLTWFRKDFLIKWLHPENLNKMRDVYINLL